MRVIVRREPSFSDALQRLVDSTQSLAAHRLELFRATAADELRRAAPVVAWRMLAAVAGIGAWGLLVGAMIVQLSERWDLSLVLVGFALLHVAMAALAYIATRGVTRGPR